EDLDIPGFDQLRDYVENTQLKERPFSRNTMEDITSMGTLFQRYVLGEIIQEEFCQKAQNITDNF
ncbi:MAG TPA: ABC transporter substrate-binding protein, partial [Candidatus Blautia merdipullorum]|nr:ABC transporter substrate-binding protein [Candidatus Blautia merdipullorum]